MIHIPLDDSGSSVESDYDERLIWDISYQAWRGERAPRTPPEPPIPIPDDGFLRRVRANG